MISNKNSSSKLLALVGPPGVGKTALARSLSQSLNLPFSQISLGGLSDASVLKGHNPTYLSSENGAITKSLISMGCLNGVLFLDEIDKLNNKKKNSDNSNVSDSLLNVIDFTQNNEFHDHYMPQIPIDLSKLFIIISLNDPSDVDEILLNRMNLVHVKGYTASEKEHIVKEFFIPKIMKNLHINSEDVIVTKEAIRFLVSKSMYQKGVRQLEMDINGVFQRINTLKLIKNSSSDINLSYSIKDFSIPFKLTEGKIKKLYK